MQWLQDPNHRNLENLNIARYEASKHFRNKKREYLKANINEPETISKNKNTGELYSGINDFKKGYQLRTNITKTRQVIWLQTARVFRLGVGIILLSYQMYRGASSGTVGEVSCHNMGESRVRFPLRS
jgi:hypothetical protein